MSIKAVSEKPSIQPISEIDSSKRNLVIAIGMIALGIIIAVEGTTAGIVYINSLSRLSTGLLIGGSLVTGIALSYFGYRIIQTSSPASKKKELVKDSKPAAAATSQLALTRYHPRKYAEPKVLQTAKMGDFDPLGPDVSFKILSFLEPRDLARMKLVCRKAWNYVHDETRWQKECERMHFLQCLSYTPPESYVNYFFSQSGDIFFNYNRDRTHFLPLQSVALRAFGMRPYAFALSSTGKLAATVNLPLKEDGTLLSVRSTHAISLWDFEKQKPLAIFRGHKDLVSLLAFADDANTLISISGNDDKTMCFWKIGKDFGSPQAEEEVELVGSHNLFQSSRLEHPVYSLTYAQGGIFFTGQSNAIQGWMIDKNVKKTELLDGLSGPVTSLHSFRAVDKTLFLLGTTAANQNNVMLWVKEKGEKAEFQAYTLPPLPEEEGAPANGAHAAAAAPRPEITFSLPADDSCLRLENEGNKIIPSIFTLNRRQNCLSIFQLRQVLFEDKRQKPLLLKQKPRIQIHLVPILKKPIPLPQPTSRIFLYGNTLAFTSMNHNRGEVYFLNLPQNTRLFFRELDQAHKTPAFFNPDWAVLGGESSLIRRELYPAIKTIHFLPNAIVLSSPNATQITLLKAPTL